MRESHPKHRWAGEDVCNIKVGSLEAAISAMHKHPTAVAFTYILPDGEHKLGGTVFLKSKKPVRARPLLPAISAPLRCFHILPLASFKSTLEMVEWIRGWVIRRCYDTPTRLCLSPLIRLGCANPGLFAVGFDWQSSEHKTELLGVVSGCLIKVPEHKNKALWKEMLAAPTGTAHAHVQC